MDEIRQAVLRKIPLRVRVALIATLAERALDLFSPYFRKRFYANQAMPMIWEAVDGTVDVERAEAMIKKIGIRAENYAGKELYSFGTSFLPADILGEILKPDGIGTMNAIYGAAGAYVDQCLYRRNIGYGDRRIRKLVTEIQSLDEPVIVVAQEAIKIAKTMDEKTVTRDSFDFIKFPDPLSPAASRPFLEVLAKRPNPNWPPPKHEIPK